ncbi:DNA internalization-related competence protein ComEC/Rec2 [Vibrio aquaticus]|uniref:DNA internalization-related competence protein ComEC/Rec2 n=1 Tax=Vibrio aquaticus TaxID=2496559 RepID=A0A3S0P7S2_9VIBR|nr:DNA internalization-related competence protein ComEC/Rec2 [Vibrio aquaticus]
MNGNLLQYQTEKLFKAGQDINIIADVDSLFKPISRGFQGRVVVRSMNGYSLNRLVQPKIRLTSPVPMQLGDKFNGKVQVKPIVGLFNDVGFDAETYALSQSIVGSARVINESFFVISSRSLRGAALVKFNQHSLDLTHRDLALALLFGIRDEISQQTWSKLQYSGLSHLIAISGLHIGIAFGLGWGFGKLLLRFHWCFTIVPIGFGLLVALTYAWLAGFSIPTQRAVLMCVLLCVVQSLPGRVSYPYKWWLVLASLLFIDPFSSVSTSLWLSMYAVGVVFLFLSFQRGASSLWRKAFMMQLVLVLLMMPISAFLFHGVALGAVFYNLIFVPWFSFVVVPLILVSFVWSYTGYGGAVLWELVDLSLSPVVYLIEFAQWGWIDVSRQMVVVGSLLLVLTFSSLVLNRVGVMLVGVVSSIYLVDWKKAPHWELVVFDVGHGLAVAAKQQDRMLLYDTGAAWSTSSIAEQIISPYMIKSGVDSLDFLLLSHLDNDHSGGWQTLVEKWRPKTVMSSQKEIGGQACVMGQKIKLGEIHLEVLWPPKRVTRAYNPHSCVVLITDETSPFRVLLTGDIETIAEWHLVRQPEKIHADVLLVPHHGSKTSSIARFVEVVQPDYAIASTAKGGRWNLPNQEVVERYQNEGANWRDTGTSGQVVVKFYSDGIDVGGLRDSKGHHWYRQMLRKGVE